MAILGAIVGLLGAALFLLIRMNMAADAARGLADTADDARGLFRRWRWRRKLATDVLAEVDDPRLAAAAMMVGLAQADGAMTATERTVIEKSLTGSLGASAQAAGEMVAHARWLVRNMPDADEAFRKLTPVILKTCGPDEIRDLLSMLDCVASADGKPGEPEQQALDRLRRALTRR